MNTETNKTKHQSTQTYKKISYTCLVIPAAVANGIVGGVVSVVTSYFFKPVWNRITKIWEKDNDSKIN